MRSTALDDISKLGRYLFSVHTAQGGAVASGSIVAFTGVAWDPEGLFSPGAACRFTAPVDGWYEFHLHLAAACSAADQGIVPMLRFLREGVTLADRQGALGYTRNAAQDAAQSMLSLLYRMSAGQYVEPRFTTPGSVATADLYASTSNWWMGRLVAL